MEKFNKVMAFLRNLTGKTFGGLITVLSTTSSLIAVLQEVFKAKESQASVKDNQPKS